MEEEEIQCWSLACPPAKSPIDTRRAGSSSSGSGPVSSMIARRYMGSCHQGLTLVHFSAQPEPFLTPNTP